MSLVPWTELHAGESPFVMVFDRIGLPAAAGIINFVVITAAASSCNGGIFSTGRMLYTLAQFGQAPRAFGKVNRNHVPATGITASVAVMLIGVVLNYFIPEQVFVYVTSVALVGALWTWAHDRDRAPRLPPGGRPGRGGAGRFRMPGAPYTNWLVLVFLGVVAVFLGIDESTRVAIYVAPIWFALLGLGYHLSRARAAAAGMTAAGQAAKAWPIPRPPRCAAGGCNEGCDPPGRMFVTPGSVRIRSRRWVG